MKLSVRRSWSRAAGYVTWTALLVMSEGCAPALRAPAPEPAPAASPTPAAKPAMLSGSVPFVATAYCQGTITATGTAVARGIVAADPSVLPLGTVIRVAGLGPSFGALYTVTDTGARVIGRHIDLYIADCRAAQRFGVRPVRVSIVRSRPSG